MLHGACPSALLLCHQVARTEIHYGGPGDPPRPTAPLAELVRVYESAASWVHPARVAGVALHTGDVDEGAAREACWKAETECRIPATDPVRFGAEPLADALVVALEERRRNRAFAS